MEDGREKSLYAYIAEAVIDGELPDTFSLPKNQADNEIRWMDGARDGVIIYHVYHGGYSGVSEEEMRQMEKAVHAAAEKRWEEAEGLFGDLGERVRAIEIIDELQSYVIGCKEELSARNLYDFAVHAILDSSSRECVKFGLSLLELFCIEDEELKNAIRTLGLSDEFSIFVIFIMRCWEDGNNEVYQLAKKIHGWGRIHAIERLEPETEEIREWLQKDGVHNRILPAYSALECWRKSGAESVLKGHPSREEFSEIRDIIEGLLDEGPVLGISQIEDNVGIITAFLHRAGEMELVLPDYEVIREIRLHYEDGDSGNPAVAALCQELLHSEACREAVREAVKEGRSIGLAKDLQLDFKEDIWNLLKDDFGEKFYLCNLLMEDPAYQSAVLELFRKNLPLEEMKTSPTDSLGLGEEYRQQHQLESIVQELRRYPLEGADLIETALQSAPTRVRNLGVGVLESWTEEKKMPLKELMPKMHSLLCRLRDMEINEKTKERMERLCGSLEAVPNAKERGL